ncbi:MAG: acyl-CoA dehydrogenase [Rhodospirillales bacterium]|nr:acyl-CoA dehydrogenase [Rhodospirillales bacterium]
MSLDIAHLKSWIGRHETVSDIVAPWPVAALAALLDRDDPYPTHDTHLPPGGHWLYFRPAGRQSEIGPDGHLRRGVFLPPVPLPRRMWAGGRLEFLRPIRIGDTVTRVSRIADVALKEGRAGPLAFVRVDHEISGSDGPALKEEHDIVYRDVPAPGSRPAAPPAAPEDATWRRAVTPDPVMLFRYSALTFNGHRIHYDQPYATRIEGYPGLVVHGPLIATLLMDLIRRERPEARMSRFAYRAASPLFDTAPFALEGKPATDGRTAKVWARGSGDALAMTGDATFV